MKVDEADKYFSASCKSKLFDHIFLGDDLDILYADLQDGIAAHSPMVVAISHKPLVVVGPFGTLHAASKHISQESPIIVRVTVYLPSSSALKAQYFIIVQSCHPEQCNLMSQCRI